MRAGGTLAQFAVKRPVATAMVWFAVAFLGVIAWIRLPQELFPSISFPQLTIITRYPNAAPEEIENLITKVLEESVGTVPNLRRVRSVSKEGVSLVTLDFGWGTNMGFAHLAVREKIDQLKDRLPHDAEEPIIQRVNPFAQPIMVIALSGDRSLLELTEVAQRAVKQRLEKVDGVAAAIISGGQEREILVEVDQGRLEASKVSLPAVIDALRNSNLNYPAGTTQGKFYEYLVRTIGEFTDIPQIGQTMISVESSNRMEEEGTLSSGVELGAGGGLGGVGGGLEERHDREKRLLPLSALATVREGEKVRTSFSRYNGKETVAVSIQKQGEANTVQTAVRVRHALEELSGVLPRGLRLEVVYDESGFILQSIAGVRNDALMGALLAFLVLFYFLKTVRDALTVCTAIPMSIFAVFVGMSLQGISINMISLAGLGLSMGNFVDNAIVVIENIARHRHKLGRGAAEASLAGTEEVGASM
ncbi:MAG: efflux RND transporter permease subunit, partial [Elusimicrobia bacterium]|nr:efflux RND transporter permease subunit [Elusimicrobiota bacterium]